MDTAIIIGVVLLNLALVNKVIKLTFEMENLKEIVGFLLKSLKVKGGDTDESK